MLEAKVNPRLIKIEELVNSDLKTQSSNVHTLQTEIEKIVNDIKLQSYNIDLTIMAMLEIMEESELKIPDFSRRVGERKLQIDKNITEAMEADKKKNEQAAVEVTTSQDTNPTVSAS